ncbi:MAG: tRNA modification GTPase, partial [Polaribacter sp.]
STYNSLDVKSRNNLAFGIGYKLNDKYGLEMRYQTSREILSDFVFWNSNYNTLSIIFGYSFF